MALWRYHEETDGNIETALSNLQSWINNNKKLVGYSIKFAASNQKTNPARAVAFWCESAVATGSSDDNPTMHFKSEETFGDYEEIYNETCDTLSKLTNFQASCASITFTNMSGKDATMSVWYPFS